MPKIKTHTGAKKRFSVTKNGKVKMASAFTGHDIKGTKSSKQKRKLRKGGYVDVSNEANVKKMIPYK